MKLHILGCSAGIGNSRRTTSLLIDDTLLVDAGSGIGDLDIEQLLAIERVLLTHSHLDHCALLPMLADLRIGRRTTPLPVCGLPETLATLRDCLFNNRLWPDYTHLPDPQCPYVSLQALSPGQILHHGSVSIEVLPAQHSIPAVGYLLADSSGAFAFSGDSALHLPFWRRLAQQADLRAVMAEMTYPESRREVAQQFGHMCASDLAQGMALLPTAVELLVSHLDPGCEPDLMAEIRALLPNRPVTQAASGTQRSWPVFANRI